MNKLPLGFLVAVQISFCLIIGIAAGLALRFDAICYAWLGGLTVVLANAWYLWRLHAIAPGDDSAQVLVAYYKAEAGKILVFVLLLGGLLTTARQYSGTNGLMMHVLLGSFLLNSVFVTVSNSREIKRWLALQGDNCQRH